MFKDIEFNPDAYALKGEELEDTTALMFGRRSYESFSTTWPTSEDHVSYKELPKYVVSSTLAEDASSMDGSYEDPALERGHR